MKTISKRVLCTLLIAVSIISLIGIQPTKAEAATKPKEEISKDTLSDQWISESLHETVSYKCMDYDLPRYKDKDWCYRAAYLVLENWEDDYGKPFNVKWIKKMAEKCKIDKPKDFTTCFKDLNICDFGKVVYDEEYYNKATSTERLKPINLKLKIAMTGFKVWIVEKHPGYKIDTDNDSTNNGKGKIATIYKGHTSSVLGIERKAGDVFTRDVWYSVKYTENGKLVDEELYQFQVTIEIVDKLTSKNKTWYKKSITETVSEKWQEMFTDDFKGEYAQSYFYRSAKEKNKKNYFDGRAYEKQAQKLYYNQQVEFDPVKEAKNYPETSEYSDPDKLLDQILSLCSKNGPYKTGKKKVYMCDIGKSVIDRGQYEVYGEMAGNLVDDVKYFAVQNEFMKDVLKKNPKYRKVTQEERVDFILNNVKYKSKVIDFTDFSRIFFSLEKIQSGDEIVGYHAFTGIAYDGKKIADEFVFVVKWTEVIE